MKKGTSNLRRSVFCDDRSNLEIKSGYLKKKSKNGSWQKRYFHTNNSHLNYYGSKDKIDQKHLKATIDLRDLVDEPRLIGRFGEFALQVSEDASYYLKAENALAAQEWVRALEERRQHYVGLGRSESIDFDGDEDLRAQLVSIPSDLSTPCSSQVSPQNSPLKQSELSKNPVVQRIQHFDSSDGSAKSMGSIGHFKMEGMLLKQSPSRFKAWQERYFKLSNGSLYYYKSQKSDASCGRIFIDRSCTIATEEPAGNPTRKYRLGRNGTGITESMIYITTKFRTYVLQATSVDVQQQWVDALQGVCNFLKAIDDNEQKVANKEAKEKLEQLKQIREREQLPPEWVIEADKLTDAEKLESIQANLNERFADSKGDVLRVINASTSLIEEIEDISRDCLPAQTADGKRDSTFTETGRLPREDIFELYLKFFHMRLVLEISEFVLNDVYRRLSSQDLLRLMDLMVAYDDKLKEILTGDIGDELFEKFGSFFDLFNENVEKMAETYIERLEQTLGDWVENIVGFTLSGDGPEIHTRNDGRVETSAPVDIFNMVNETMIMAESSGVEPLIASALSTCLVIVADYLNHVVHDLKENKGPENKFHLYCALTNDCWVVSEQLEQLRDGYEQVIVEYGIEFESIQDQYSDGTLLFINSLATIVNNDFEVLQNQLFTKIHLHPESENETVDIISRVAATVEDYLLDLKRLLDPPYFLRVSKFVIQQFNVSYCTKLLRSVSGSGLKKVLATMSDGLRKISPAEIQVIKSDKEKLMASLISTSPTESDISRLFAPEFVILDDILDLLEVTPDFFSVSLYKVCAREEDFVVQNCAVFVAKCCLRLRTDVDSKLCGEIEEAIKELSTTVSQEAEKVKDDPTSKGYMSRFSNPYIKLCTSLNAAVTSQLRRDSSVRNVIKAFKHAKNRLDGKLSPSNSESTIPEGSEVQDMDVVVTPSWDIAGQFATRSATRSVISRDTSNKLMGARTPVDISDIASRKRRIHRRARISLVAENEEPEVDLHGYMEKRNDQRLWHRRWFIVRKMFDSATTRWRTVLAWHKDYNAPPKSWLFVDEIVDITFSPLLDVVKQANGISYALKKGAKKNKGLIKTSFNASPKEFRVHTADRVYILRTQSISDTLHWINGLNEVRYSMGLIKPSNDQDVQVEKTVRKIEIEQKNIQDTRSVQDQRQLAEDAWKSEHRKLVSMRTISQLRESCARAGIDTSHCVEKSDLVDLVMDRARNMKDNPIIRDDDEIEVDEMQNNTIDDVQLRRERVNSLEAELQANICQLIGKGYEILEGNKHFEAIGMFDKAVREAQGMSNKKLEAQALSGLGSAYMQNAERISAAPIIFEMSADLYKACGEQSGYESSIIDAANAYQVANDLDSAKDLLIRNNADANPILKKKLELIQHDIDHPIIETDAQNKTGWKKALRMLIE